MDKAEREKRNARIAQIQTSLIDAVEAIVESVTARFDTAARGIPAPPVDVARRQIANLLKLSRFCDRAACRRSHCCRGQPLHCLQMAMPLLPADAFGGILRKQPARRLRKAMPREQVVVPAQAAHDSQCKP